MKTVVSFLICFFISNISLNAQAVESEPNDAPAQANSMPLNGSGTGAMSPAGNIDWWKVTTNSDGELDITFDNTGNPDLKYVSLYDKGGVTLLINTAVGNGKGGISKKDLAAGTYYIKIEGQLGNETGGYALSNVLIGASKPNDKEPNDIISKAIKLKLNDSTTGHIGYYYNNHRDSSDWYKITTTEDGMIKLFLDNTGNTLGLTYLQLFDKNGTTLLAQVSIGNGARTLYKDGLAAGTYYVLVSPEIVTHAFGPYTLADSLLKYKYNADVEPDDHPYQANNLTLDSITNGHLNFYYNNNTDVADWYKINYNGSGKISFNIKIQPSLATNSINEMHLEVYKDTLQAAVYTQALSSETNTFKLAHGKYYLKIYPDFQSTGPDAYSIKNSAPALDEISMQKENNPLYKWNISGNAAANNCSVQLKLDADADVSIRVTSLSGNTVQIINKGKIEKGSYNIPLNFSNTISGMYVVNVIVNNQVNSKNVVK